MKNKHTPDHDETVAPPAFQGPMYQALARSLIGDIQSGRYAVGGQLPTEADLRKRFNVSRHTVREAMRELQEQGYVSTHHGIGTRVRAKGSTFRFVQGASTLDDLVEFSNATRMQVIGQRELIADERHVGVLQCPVGQAWLELAVLRFVPGNALPIGFLSTYLRPEFAAVVPLIESSRRPVFTLVEKQFGIRLAEMEQEIASVSIPAELQDRLQTPPGAHGLQITRRYRDQQGKVTQISVGIYPSDRLVHTAKLRIHRDASPTE